MGGVVLREIGTDSAARHPSDLEAGVMDSDRVVFEGSERRANGLQVEIQTGGAGHRIGRIAMTDHVDMLFRNRHTRNALCTPSGTDRTS